ncbi:mitochondrial import receptor subunit TOM70 isoform X1 [Ixodes scapularis]
MASSEMVRNAGSSSNSSGLSKWQYALLFGTPVAAGLAIWYYKRTRDRKKKPSDSGSGKSAKSEDRTLSHNSRSATDVEQNPYEKAKAFKNQGNKYFKGGKFDKAIECYTEAINICPKEHVSELATFFQNRAAAFDNLKNYKEVISDCSRAIELNGTYIKALHRRAKAYELVDELKKCLEDITAVCILEGFQNQNSLMVTDRVLKKLGKASAKEIVKTRKPTMPSKHFIRNYFVSFCEDPIIEATQAFRQGKAPQPEDSEEQKSGFALAVECLAREEYEKVVAHCNAEVDGGGKCAAEALLLRGTFHLLQGRSQATLDDLNQLLSMDNISSKVRVNALIKLGTLKVHSEHLDEALQDFERAAELDPANADIFLHRGQVLMLLDRLEDTLQDMERTCTLRPDFPSAAAQRCYVQYRCGMRATDPEQRQKALDGFAEVQQRFPNCPESYFLHAQLLTETQEFDKAEEYFRKAEKADPTDPNVYVHLGILQLQWKQDFDKAVQYLQKAIDMDEKCQFAYETFGSIQVQRGFLKEGLELFEKAIALAQTETELAHLLSLRDAAEAQGLVAQRLGIVVGPGLS